MATWKGDDVTPLVRKITDLAAAVIAAPDDESTYAAAWTLQGATTDFMGPTRSVNEHELAFALYQIWAELGDDADEADQPEKLSSSAAHARMKDSAREFVATAGNEAAIATYLANWTKARPSG
jgi:hypothetical protein